MLAKRKFWTYVSGRATSCMIVNAKSQTGAFHQTKQTTSDRVIITACLLGLPYLKIDDLHFARLVICYQMTLKFAVNRRQTTCLKQII